MEALAQQALQGAEPCLSSGQVAHCARCGDGPVRRGPARVLLYTLSEALPDPGPGGLSCSGVPLTPCAFQGQRAAT